jgi:hypothetical protein
MDGRVFLYRGYSVGFGGVLTRPSHEVIDAQASVALPIVGGLTSTRVQNYRLRELISFKEARMYTTGSRSADGAYNTVVSATIEGLNILDVITCDACVGRVSSRHAPDAAEPEIVSAGSTFHNLKIGGYPVDVQFDHKLFADFPTYTQLRGEFEKNADFRERVQTQFMWTSPWKNFPPGFVGSIPMPNTNDWPESRGIVPCTLVKDITCDAPEMARYGHILCLPQVGYIVLGEFFVSQYARRLTMMRLALGSPVEGMMSACDLETDGTTYP